MSVVLKARIGALVSSLWLVLRELSQGRVTWCGSCTLQAALMLALQIRNSATHVPDY